MEAAKHDPAPVGQSARHDLAIGPDCTVVENCVAGQVGAASVDVALNEIVVGNVRCRTVDGDSAIAGRDDVAVVDDRYRGCVPSIDINGGNRLVGCLDDAISADIDIDRTFFAR